MNLRQMIAKKWLRGLFIEIAECEHIVDAFYFIRKYHVSTYDLIRIIYD